VLLEYLRVSNTKNSEIYSPTALESEMSNFKVLAFDVGMAEGRRARDKKYLVFSWQRNKRGECTPAVRSFFVTVLIHSRM
jgi:hypothetical protein